jgi:hypothetical protein
MPELIRIDSVAKLIGRKTDTVRKWCDRGFAPDGTRLNVHRDEATKIRYLERVQVDRVVAGLFPSKWKRAAAGVA